MKAYSSDRVLAHPSKLEDLACGRISPPIQVRIKPINSCNHDCFFCAYASGARRRHLSSDVIEHLDTKMHSGTNLRDKLSRDDLLGLIEDLAAFGVKSITLTGGGEPLLHESIKDCFDLAHSLGLQTSLITNGSLIEGDLVDSLLSCTWIRVSIDYDSPESIHKTRNVPHREYHKIMKNLKQLVARKSSSSSLNKPEIGVNYIVHKDNIDGIEAFSRELDKIGIDNIRFSPMWLPDFKAYHEPLKERFFEAFEMIKLSSTKMKVYSSYNLDDSCHDSMRPLSKCYIQELIPVVGADKKIYRCHHTAFTNTGYLGSIEQKRFSEAWLSECAQNIKGFNCIDSCRHQCVYDARNSAIDQILRDEAWRDNVSIDENDIFRNFV